MNYQFSVQKFKSFNCLFNFLNFSTVYDNNNYNNIKEDLFHQNINNLDSWFSFERYYEDGGEWISLFSKLITLGASALKWIDERIVIG